MIQWTEILIAAGVAMVVAVGIRVCRARGPLRASAGRPISTSH